MITIDELAKYIQKQLNEEATAKDNKEEYKYTALNTDRKKYIFKIFTHTGEYLKAKVDGNVATYYINCILSENGATVESTGFVNAIMNASLDLLVPVKKGMFGATPEIVKSVSEILNNVLSKNSLMTLDDYPDYQIGVNYSMASSGERDTYEWVGDGFTFSADIEFYIIEQGVNSNNIVYTFNDEPIYFTTGGMTRGAQQETQVTSKNSNKVAKSITTASVLTFTFVIPMRNDEISKAIEDYINTGEIKTYTIKKIVKYPNKEEDPEPQEFNMIFSEAVESYDTVKNVGMQVTMVEAFE